MSEWLSPRDLLGAMDQSGRAMRYLRACRAAVLRKILPLHTHSGMDKDGRIPAWVMNSDGLRTFQGCVATPCICCIGRGSDDC